MIHFKLKKICAIHKDIVIILQIIFLNRLLNETETPSSLKGLLLRGYFWHVSLH